MTQPLALGAPPAFDPARSIGDDGPVQDSPRDAPTAPSAAPKRPRIKGLKDMTLSLVVCFAIVAAALLLLPRPQVDAVKVVEYRSVLVQASRVAPYPVLGPENLVAAWRATSVRVDVTGDPQAVSVHLGFVTPLDQYVGLEQTDGTTRPFVSEYTGGAPVTGSRDIGGRSWVTSERLVGSKHQRSLVLYSAGSTTVISGTADWPELDGLAGSLHPVNPSAPAY